MKRVNNLYDKIISIRNLELADRKAQRGKKKQPQVIKHNLNKDENIKKLHNILVNNNYVTSKYNTFKIYEPKERLISSLPYFPDRILHHAIMNYLEKILVRSFINTTYSCIKRRGIHKCLANLNKSLRDIDNTKYCLKLDIRKFYQSVDKKILKFRIRTKIKDKKLLILLDEIIDSNIEGLPLGNYSSQWLGNLYLNKFDHWLKEIKRVKYYFRYCDDIVILHKDKEYLHNLRLEIQEYLNNNLKLILSNYQVFPTAIRGIDFVGYKSYPKYIKLRKTIKQRFKRMLLKNKNRKSIASYNGWLYHCNSINLQEKYL